MTIGISPEYNYPGLFRKWQQDNTYFASNHGASLITRAIMREFNAEYISDLTNPFALRGKYDTCFLALATHAHARRDISRYVDFLEKLQMKTIVLSLGVEDYVSTPSTSYKFHPSVIRLLNLASESSKWIGVRGPYTASIVQQNGIKNVVPIGCPSIYWNLKEKFSITLKPAYSKPLISYHKTLMKGHYDFIKNHKLLGQDFQDHAIFTDELTHDDILKKTETNYYKKLGRHEEKLNVIRKNGFFPKTFDAWFSALSEADFVIGARLHGCIGALIQGIPAIFIQRDLRMKEMVEFFNLPHLTSEFMQTHKIDDVYQYANFDKFIETYRLRFRNYLAFIRENQLFSNLESNENYAFQYTPADIQTTNWLIAQRLNALEKSTTMYKLVQLRNKYKKKKNVLRQKMLRTLGNLYGRDRS